MDLTLTLDFFPQFFSQKRSKKLPNFEIPNLQNCLKSKRSRKTHLLAPAAQAPPHWDAISGAKKNTPKRFRHDFLTGTPVSKSCRKESLQTSVLVQEMRCRTSINSNFYNTVTHVPRIHVPLLTSFTHVRRIRGPCTSSSLLNPVSAPTPRVRERRCRFDPVQRCGSGPGFFWGTFLTNAALRQRP